MILKPLPLKIVPQGSYLNGEALKKELRSYASAHFKKELDDEYNLLEKSIDSVASLRSKLIGLVDSKEGRCEGEMLLQVHEEYLRALVDLRRHFRFGKHRGGGLFGTVERIKFKWSFYDAFLMRKGSPHGSYEIDYEISAILFNIAASYSVVASFQDKSSLDGLKVAARSFLKAAGVFKFIEDHAGMMIFSNSTKDMQLPCIRFLQAFMTAQAAYCTAQNAITQNMKAFTIARLLKGASDSMTAADEFLNRPEMAWLKSAQFNYHKYVKYTCTMLQAQVHVYMAKHFLELEEIGNEIGNLRAARELIEEAKKYESSKSIPMRESRMEILEIVKDRLVKAESDNQLIYAAPVPSVSELDPVESRVLGLPTPFELPDRTFFQVLDKK